MALFDFKFCKFISPSLMQTLYMIGFIILTFAFVIAEVMLFRELSNKYSSTEVTLLKMICAPLGWLLSLTILRTWLEFVMAIFNLERLARHIEENTRKH